MPEDGPPYLIMHYVEYIEELLWERRDPIHLWVYNTLRLAVHQNSRIPSMEKALNIFKWGMTLNAEVCAQLFPEPYRQEQDIIWQLLNMSPEERDAIAGEI